ncbi:MAG: hypothetical protein JRC68_08905 [Deltaproteobacteria bacterium]|nr:hypothetical protein [Deltaproteobacteria bacterium]
MAGLFTNKDGRLKTGRVAILVFAGLLMALAMLFKINSSVDHALLAVKHVFEPEEIQPIREKPAVKQDIARVVSAKDKEVEQKRAQLPDKTRTEEKKKVDPVGNGKTGEAAKDQKMADSSPVKSAAYIEKDPMPKEAAGTDEKIVRAESPAKDAEKVEPETQSPRLEKPNSEQEMAVPGRAETDGRVVFDLAGLAKIARKSSGGEPVKPKSESKTINVSEKLNGLTATPKQPKEKEWPETSKALGRLYKTNFLDADRNKREVTVDQKQYKALFHSWRIAGKEGKGKEKTPLRVENLRNTYDLFQMKPVAVIRGNAFLDLSDGTRVAEKSLEEYSTTVFLVDRPWDKWGKALASAGIRRGDRFEVRYYMYDFIKDAIYARVNQAFSWCRETGLIPGDLPAGAVNVLGRAYVINRQGGGRFGVFVPVSLDTEDGRTVAVDSACFRGQADVETLREAGLL